MKESKGPCTVTIVKEGFQSEDLRIRARALTFDEYRKIAPDSEDLWKDKSPAEGRYLIDTSFIINSSRMLFFDVYITCTHNNCTLGIETAK